MVHLFDNFIDYSITLLPVPSIKITCFRSGSDLECPIGGVDAAGSGVTEKTEKQFIFFLPN